MLLSCLMDGLPSEIDQTKSWVQNDLLDFMRINIPINDYIKCQIPRPWKLESTISKAYKEMRVCQVTKKY